MIGFDGSRDRRSGHRGALRRTSVLAWGSIALLHAGCAELLVPHEEPQIDCAEGGADCESAAPAACDAGLESQCAAQQQVCLEGGCQSIVKLAAGGGTTCALSSGSLVFCWGSNGDGQCGVAPGSLAGGDKRVVPVRVGLPEDAEILDIAVGGDGESGHACALSGDGRLWCWGDNRFGQSGYAVNGQSWPSPLRMALPGSAGRVDQVRAGPGRTCVIGTPPGKAERRVWCRGEPLQAKAAAGEWEQAGGFSDVTDVALGKGQACILSLGELLCLSPKVQGVKKLDLEGSPAISGIAAADGHVCALAGTEARCWDGEACIDGGQGCHPQELAARSFPADLLGTPLFRLAAGGERVCRLDAWGDVRCWRWDTPDSGEPVRRLGAVNLVLGSHHACVGVSEGDVKCWGQNDLGQLGRGKSPPIGGEEEPRPVKWYDYAGQSGPPSD